MSSYWPPVSRQTTSVRKANDPGLGSPRCPGGMGLDAVR